MGNSETTCVGALSGDYKATIVDPFFIVVFLIKFELY